MNKRPFLLITNDDGISANGLRHLWESVRHFADVAIVAPLHEKSGSGLSITWSKPLMIQQASWDNTPAWSISGTPADCVKLALTVLLEKRPDMVISGINNGSNAGRTVLYSGTIGGVIEGTFKGIPGIAFSFLDGQAPPLSATQQYIYPLIKHFLEHPLPQGSLLNVNFPFNAKDSIKGFKLTKQGRGCWLESPDKRTHPEGMHYYWLGGKWCSSDEHPDSDVYWLNQGYVTGVPIHVGELTDVSVLSKHKAAIEEQLSDSITPGPHPAHSP
ncbi:MAG TPA: 5'/3'-nucleotidase SurE [Chlamydiales bacterium]|nr:5'/3'-nucleotidase SurE [Chlamydiales bacterium]